MSKLGLWCRIGFWSLLMISCRPHLMHALGPIKPIWQAQYMWSFSATTFLCKTILSADVCTRSLFPSHGMMPRVGAAASEHNAITTLCLLLHCTPTAAWEEEEEEKSGHDKAPRPPHPHPVQRRQQQQQRRTAGMHQHCDKRGRKREEHACCSSDLCRSDVTVVGLLTLSNGL